MVFSSLPFLLLFLPITIVIYYLLLRYNYGKLVIPFLLVASLFFYAYWNPVYLLLIIFSIGANYGLGQSMNNYEPRRKQIFILGVSMNLMLLAYFKYTDFFITNLNEAFSTQIPLTHIILPIGISFYTFQQIAYLTDIFTKKHIDHAGGFVEYATFVCFFPQLIAGPIVHHAEMMPQFADKQNQVVRWENIHTGLCFLSIGLAKKVLIADNLSPLVGYSFDQAHSLSFLESLFGGLAYLMQIYFDFSGYADMAIGCALFFNIQLPLNFNSPFKALSIQDFWRRWHMTLSRWLRDYLYFPLGGNKGSSWQTMRNIFVPFLLGGIWHGAGWNYVLWGALHGIALVINRAWSQIYGLKMPKICAWVITFIFVGLSGILLRTINFERAKLFIDGLTGLNGFGIREEFAKMCYNTWRNSFGIGGGVIEYTVLLIALTILCISQKNTQELMQYIGKKSFMLYIIALLTLSLIYLVLPGYSPEFIYFQF